MKLPNPWRTVAEVERRGLAIGEELHDAARVWLPSELLSTGLHVLGPAGVGKTSLLFGLFQLLQHLPRTTIIALGSKGDFGRWCRDSVIANGQTRRLIWWDPGSEPAGPTPGFDPLKPNGLAVSTHAKITRAAVQAAWNQVSWDQTPQLQRGLYLALGVAREVQGSFEDALEVLRPGSAARRALLASVRDQFLRQELEYVNSLKDARQEELLASTYARLASFVGDPLIRRIITQRERSIDFAEIIRSHGIAIFNLELYRPLAPDDVELLGRLIINALLQAVFERGPGDRTRVVLIIDEAQRFATSMLCDALDQGRELGLSTVLAHQYLEQLRAADPSGKLLASVKNDARTKIIFGGNWVTDLDEVVRDAFIDQYTPWAVKDELTQLELEPVETTREAVGSSFNWNIGAGVGASFTSQTGTSEEEGESETMGESEAFSESEAITETHGTTRTRGHGHSRSMTGGGEGSDDDGLVTEGESEFETEGESAGSGTSHGTSQTRGTHRSRGTSKSRGKTSSVGFGITPSIQGSIGGSRTSQRVPWHKYKKRRVVSSRTFLSQDEQLALWLQKVKAQPVGHFVLKVPSKPAVFLRAPFVEPPNIGDRKRKAGLDRMYALRPYYATAEEIADQERRRAADPRKALPSANSLRRQYPKTLWKKGKAKDAGR